MKVLVTGANGLLGVNLARELVRRGETVKAFVRPSADVRILAAINCEIVRGSILSYDDISTAVSDCGWIVHAASTTSVVPRDFEFYRKVNVVGTENVIQAVLKQQNKKLIYVSTSQAFDPGTKENPGTELSAFTLNRFHSGYINSKQIAQQQVLEAVKQHGLNAVVVNPTFIVGPYDAKPSSGKIILHGLKRGIQWYPAGGKNFVYAGDVAAGIYRALLSGKSGECFLLAGENLTYREFFALLNKTVGRNPVRGKIPQALLFSAGHVADIWSRFTHRKFAFNKSNVQLLTLDNYYSGAKANLQFNLTPTPIRQALAEAVDWFRQEHYLSQNNYSIQGTNFDL